METPINNPGDEMFIEELDYFSKCPEDIKFIILTLLNEPLSLCRLSRVSKLWKIVASEDRIWKSMFFRDFVCRSPSENDLDKEDSDWKEIYAEYYAKGWQWDPTQTNSRIQLCNKNFSANLTSGYTYHGVRTSRGEEKGRHYFEVLIEACGDASKFNQGNAIYMGIGVANAKFNVENCCSGWTRDNCGVGYYNDGQIYALSERHFGRNRKVSFRTGDRVGVEFDIDQGTVVFYINGIAVTEPIHGIQGTIYPHLILANDIKHLITITTGKPPKTTSQSHESAYSEALAILESMGFSNREFFFDLLTRFNGDVERVVNEMLA